MKKYWKNEYAECFDFDTHEQILKDRLMTKKGLTKEITDKQLIIEQFLA